MSARKARVVLDHIRGRTVPEARTILAFTPRAAAREIDRVLRSAVANAESAHALDGDELVIVGGLRGRGPDPEALARPRSRPRQPHPQAHVPHHHRSVPCGDKRPKRPQKKAAPESAGGARAAGGGG